MSARAQSAAVRCHREDIAVGRRRVDHHDRLVGAEQLLRLDHRHRRDAGQLDVAGRARRQRGVGGGQRGARGRGGLGRLGDHGGIGRRGGARGDLGALGLRGGFARVLARADQPGEFGIARRQPRGAARQRQRGARSGRHLRIAERAVIHLGAGLRCRRRGCGKRAADQNRCCEAHAYHSPKRWIRDRPHDRVAAARVSRDSGSAAVPSRLEAT